MEKINNELSAIVAKYADDQVFCLVDNAVLPVWQHLVQDIHVSATLTVEVSEQIKNIATVQRIWDFLFDHHATRRGLLICVGGGVITDLGGFAASTYMRGMDYLNIPTTLLAMTDAATGGKTGFDYRGFKNAIGIIREPIATLLFHEFLATLPPRQFLSGYAELIKTALLDSPDMFHQALAELDDAQYTMHNIRLIKYCQAVKARYVASDPDEKGVRKALNLGHTIGHALEELRMEKSPLEHGYAILYGLVAEIYLSTVKLGLDRDILRQLSHLTVSVYGRPQAACKDYDRLIEFMCRDKKNDRTDEITFTLLQKIGDPVINRTATTAEIKEALDYLFSL